VGRNAESPARRRLAAMRWRAPLRERDARGLAEATRARSAGSPTVRSGHVDAQSHLQCSANRSGRQWISGELQKQFKWKRQRTLASRTARRVCTKEEGEKERRQVHDVAERPDEAGVERWWPTPM
jgi:hypothetical protein